MSRSVIQEDESEHGAVTPRPLVVDPDDPSSTSRERRSTSRRVLGRGLVAWILAYVVLAALIIGLGFLLTHVLLPDGVASVDGRVSDWFVQQRTPALDTITLVGSNLGSTGVIIGIAALTVIALAIKREWWWAGFVVATLSLEAGVSLLSSTVVDRRRPAVPRLDATPPTGSYPSGHTAASIALYIALAIVFSSLVRQVAPRVIVWIVAIAIPVFVAISRLYLGMHHLTDIAASVVLGCSALLLGWLVTLQAARRDEGRRRDATRSTTEGDAVEVAS